METNYPLGWQKGKVSTKFAKLLGTVVAPNKHGPFDALMKSGLFSQLTLNAQGTFFNWPKQPGVYVIREDVTEPAIYVGISGRIGADGRFVTNSGLHKRAYRWTPYYFDASDRCFRYGPTAASGLSKKEHIQAGYKCSQPFEDLVIDCLTIYPEDRTAPAAIEALLLQAHLEQHGRLPEANRQF